MGRFALYERSVGFSVGCRHWSGSLRGNRAQASDDLVTRSGVHQHRLPLGRADEDRIPLPYIEEVDAEGAGDQFRARSLRQHRCGDQGADEYG